MVGLILILFFPAVIEAGPRKLKFIMSFLGFGAAGLLLGPTEFLDQNHVLLYRFISFALIGVFQIFIFIPVIPEIIERIQYAYSIQEGKDEMIDM